MAALAYHVIRLADISAIARLAEPHVHDSVIFIRIG